MAHISESKVQQLKRAHDEGRDVTDPDIVAEVLGNKTVATNRNYAQHMKQVLSQEEEAGGGGLSLLMGDGKSDARSNQDVIESALSKGALFLSEEEGEMRAIYLHEANAARGTFVFGYRPKAPVPEKIEVSVNGDTLSPEETNIVAKALEAHRKR